LYLIVANCPFRRVQMRLALAMNCELAETGVVVPVGDVAADCCSAPVDPFAEGEDFVADPPQPTANIVITASTSPAKRLCIMPFLSSVDFK
jgi:hypothetical protein